VEIAMNLKGTFRISPNGIKPFPAVAVTSRRGVWSQTIGTRIFENTLPFGYVSDTPNE
jgi:hypothetical protein